MTISAPLGRHRPRPHASPAPAPSLPTRNPQSPYGASAADASAFSAFGDPPADEATPHPYGRAGLDMIPRVSALSGRRSPPPPPRPASASAPGLSFDRHRRHSGPAPPVR